MKRIVAAFITMLWLLAVPTTLQAQTEISGYVEDSLSHNRLPNVSITLLRNGKPLKFTRSKADGSFTLSVDERHVADMLQATCMGYKKTKTPVSSPKETIISMPSTAFVLKEVQVKGSRITGRDTVSFDLTRFADARDNSLKDVLKKLPGVDVAKNGQINYNGKPINRFTVEGLDLTGGKYNQLEENIKAKDVKKAEVIEHDQPIKALQNKTYTDNIAMNIALKDSARDRLMPTIKPYLLIGNHTYVGGEAILMQIGKKRQMMYDAAYDRTGKDLSGSLDELASYSNRLSAASLPAWLSAPTLEAPIDEERLRFNTSQKYSVNHISKNKQDAETRLEASYVRSLVRQNRENTSIYDLGGEEPVTTTEQTRKTMKSDILNLEWENKLNQATHYGNEHFSLNAQQTDGLSAIDQSLTQRIRIPQLNIEGSLYRLFVWKKSQLAWRSVADYHHGVADLYVNDERSRLRTNLWHTAHAVEWQKNRFHWSQRYQASIDFKDIIVGNQTSNDKMSHNMDICAKLTPFWQYKTGDLRMYFSPTFIWERFTRQQKTLLTASPFVYLNKKIDFRRELTFYTGYNTSTGSPTTYAIDQYRRSYRSWYTSADIVRYMAN